MSRTGIVVVQPGLLDTVQDLGRTGFRRYGVTGSGALDDFALRAANLLVGNPEGAAGLEITLVGPRLRFEGALTAALAGADLGAELDGRRLAPWRAFRARAGSELRFAGRRQGCRAYLAVYGGIDVPPVLGSRSTWTGAGLGGLDGRPLRAGDRLPVGAPPMVASALRHRQHAGDHHALHVHRLPASLAPHYAGRVTLRVLLGPQADYFTPEALADFLAAEWRVSERSDRMGYRLSGPRLLHRERAEIISDGIAPGSVQVPPDGQPIVILRDGQTTGGYPKLATLSQADIGRLGQAVPGDGVRFEVVSPEAAGAAWAEQLGRLRRVAHAAWRAGDVSPDRITG